MEEMKIDITELKSEGSDMIKELTSYLKEKTGAKVESTADDIVVKGEEATCVKDLPARALAQIPSQKRLERILQSHRRQGKRAGVQRQESRGRRIVLSLILFSSALMTALSYCKEDPDQNKNCSKNENGSRHFSENGDA